MYIYPNSTWSFLMNGSSYRKMLEIYANLYGDCFYEDIDEDFKNGVDFSYKLIHFKSIFTFKNEPTLGAKSVVFWYLKLSNTEYNIFRLHIPKTSDNHACANEFLNKNKKFNYRNDKTTF
jgi:hypothetical protein